MVATTIFAVCARGGAFTSSFSQSGLGGRSRRLAVPWSRHVGLLVAFDHSIIQVERGDLQGAHDLLARYAGRAANDAEYHAFDAAVLQRLGRHQEAVAGYQAALKLAPRTGLWWMGMGISLQAENRDADALGAFQRAKSVGGLNPDLVQFADQPM